jgi:hypothetical protein
MPTGAFELTDGVETVDSVDVNAHCPEDLLEVADTSDSSEAASPLGGAMRFSTGSAFSNAARTDAQSMSVLKTDLLSAWLMPMPRVPMPQVTKS